MGGLLRTDTWLMRCDAVPAPTESIQKYGTMVKSPNGYPVQSPYIAIANRQAEIMLRIAAEFGFTLASRSRIASPPPPRRRCSI
jgi:P27 family predicted phage terminase small subunit